MTGRAPRLAAALTWALFLVAGLIGSSLAHAQVSTPYTTNYVWDQNRRLTMKIEADTGAGAPTDPRLATRYVYDIDGELIETDTGTTTQSNGSDFSAQESTTYAYDAAGNKIQTLVWNGAAAPPAAASNVLAMDQNDYDADDRSTCVTVRMNPARFAALAATPVSGSTAASSLPTPACTLGTAGSYGNDRITEAVYDAAGQTVQTLRAVGDPLQQAYETFAYTADGKVQTIVDARGALTQQVYDGFDRLANFYLPSTTLPTAYTPTTQASALATAGAYDPTNYEAYQYDANDNRTQLRERDGSLINYNYDALNRETLKDVLASGSLPEVKTYTGYDLISRKLSATFASPTGSGVHYVWDNAGRLTSEATNGLGLSFLYDRANNRIQVTWGSDGFYAAYVYDALNHVTQICQNLASASCQTAPTTLPGTSTTASGLLASYSYDTLGRRTGVARTNGVSTAYAYDTTDRLASLTQNLSGTSNDQTWGTLLYNPASQLLNSPGSNTLYDWVPAAVTNNKAYDGLNRDGAFAAVGTQPCSTAGSGYDCRGNLTSEGSGGRTFTYDVENHLLSVTGSTAALSLGYDPLGRIQQTVSGSATTGFLYDGDRLSAEYSGSSIGKRYVHGTGNDEPLVWYDVAGPNSTRHWLLMDHEGSVVVASDDTGAIPSGQLYTYGPYGEPNTWPGSRFRYTGQIVLPEAALYDYKARVYDPLAGRFLQTDPVGYASDIDLYAYVSEDPLDHVDPTGLWVGADDLVALAGGALVGLGVQAISDIQGQHLSSWQDYAGSLVGGAAGGEAGLYTVEAGPVAIAAAGGAAALTGNLTKQALHALTDKHSAQFDVGDATVDTVIGTLTAGIPAGRAVRGSVVAVGKGMLTKMARGSIRKMSAKTAMKAGTAAAAAGINQGIVGAAVKHEITPPPESTKKLPNDNSTG